MNETALRWKYLKSSFVGLFGIIWAFVGTVFFFAGVVPLLVAHGSTVSAANLEGRVVQKGEDADKDGNVRRWIRFTWRDEAGVERSSLAEPSASVWARTGADESLALAAPSSPEASPRIVENQSSRSELLLFAGIGVVVGGIGWGLVATALGQAGRRAHLVSLGKAADGTVSSVEVQTNVRVNRRCLRFLTFEFRDDAGERRTGRSPFLPRRLEDRWQPGSGIRVVYDPLHPELCEADIFDARAG